MSIKARRGPLLVALMGVVVVGALLLSVRVSSPTEAQSLDPQQSSATTEAGTAEDTTTQADAAGENGLIAFESNQPTQNPEGDYEIFTMKPDGTELTNLTNNNFHDEEPAWSADGRQLAYMCNPFDWHICKMNADGSAQVQLTHTHGPAGYPTWSPDGTKIAYTDTGGHGNIYVMNADGTGQSQIASGGGLPDWSPTNNQIVFTSFRDHNEEIYKMNADGSGQTRLTNDGSFQTDTAPSWSPDGNQIVFQSNGDPTTTGYEIYKMNADGSGQTRLTAHPLPPCCYEHMYDFAPDWSPDGNQIVFEANRTLSSGGQPIYPKIFVMNADGSDQRNLTPNGVVDRSPAWQPLLDEAGPAPVEGFAATAEGSKVSLSWTNPSDADFETTRILRSTSGFATDPEPTQEQTQVYEGTTTSHADEGLTYGTTYHYTAFARDNAGNWSTAATASATIGPPPDTTSPVLSLPNDMTVEATDSSGAKVTYDPLPTATDENPANPEVSCTPSSGDSFPLDQTTVICSATDAAGNKAEGTFKVTVEDSTPPTISDVPTDINEKATSSAGAVVNYANPTASDLVDGNNVAVNCEPPSGSTFPLGQTTVTCSAQDKAGNKAEESFKVSVTYEEVSACTIGEIEPPVNNVSSATDQGMSGYKYGSRGVIPAKFRVGCNGDPIDTQAEADAHPMKLTLTKLGTTPDQDAVVENTVTGSANTGELFRFDDATDHYIYNVAVKNLEKGTYKLTISEANRGATHDEWFSIKQ